MKTFYILLIASFVMTISTATSQEKFGEAKVTQIGLVVNDIEKA